MRERTRFPRDRGGRPADEQPRALVESTSMTDTRPMLKLLDRDYLFKLILFLLAYALVPIGEIVLFIYLGNLIGNYLTFALAAVAGIGGALAALSQAQRLRERLNAKIRLGADPGAEFVDGAGILVSAVLLVTPGFVTDVIGYVLLIPAVRSAVGRLIVSKMGRTFRYFQEYLQARVR
jgi:UPF0716 protein FxsA